MHHPTPLIGTMVASLVMAFIMGAISHRLRISPIAGYLLAGVLVGPFTPGYVADTELAGELAEIGVILLMFGVGLHFSPRDLIAVRKIAVPGAIAQSRFCALGRRGHSHFALPPTLSRGGCGSPRREVRLPCGRSTAPAVGHGANHRESTRSGGAIGQLCVGVSGVHSL